MTRKTPPAYCFFQDLTPRPVLDVVFDRDYLLYAVRGALSVSVEGQSWLLPPSFGAWVPANTPFSVQISKDVTTCSILAETGFCTGFPDRPATLQMSGLAREMIVHCKDWGKDAPHPKRAEGFFHALLDVCAELAAEAVDIRRPYARDENVRKAIELAQDTLPDTVMIEDAARHVGLSKRTLQRRLGEQVGMTWSQILTQLRMIRAVEHLADNRLNITQIAGACGFESVSAFNRAFLGFAMTTPSAFRKGLQAG